MHVEILLMWFYAQLFLHGALAVYCENKLCAVLNAEGERIELSAVTTQIEVVN